MRLNLCMNQLTRPNQITPSAGRCLRLRENIVGLIRSGQSPAEDKFSNRYCKKMDPFFRYHLPTQILAETSVAGDSGIMRPFENVKMDPFFCPAQFDDSCPLEKLFFARTLAPTDSVNMGPFSGTTYTDTSISIKPYTNISTNIKSYTDTSISIKLYTNISISIEPCTNTSISIEPYSQLLLVNKLTLAVAGNDKFILCGGSS